MPVLECAVVGGFSPLASAIAGSERIGRYRLLCRLGQGGGGMVFLAFDPLRECLVALKVPRLDSLLAPELRIRFLHEAEVAAGLDHPNLLPVQDAGDDEGLSYLVSPYCPGGTLSAWLARQTSPVSPRIAALLIAALADGVHYLHDRGIWHRDIKPANVVLDVPADPGRPTAELYFTPRLTDFGLAKLCRHEAGTTRHGDVLGTPSYMAPEQAAGWPQALGPHTDVYGLGAVLYEVLTGQPPFLGRSDAETLRQVRTGVPPSLRHWRRDIPPPLESICLTCLERKPRRRYATAAALAADLQRFLDNQPVQARLPGTLTRVRQWLARCPLTVALQQIRARDGRVIGT
jgi:serine/threonine protein kinase